MSNQWALTEWRPGRELVKGWELSGIPHGHASVDHATRQGPVPLVFDLTIRYNARHWPLTYLLGEEWS